MAKQYRLGFWRRLYNRWASFRARRGRGSNWMVTTVGRRTGELRATPVTPVTVAGHKYLVAPYGEVSWVHNARGTGRVTLTRGSVSERHLAVEVPPGEAAPVLAAYLARVKVVRPYFDVTLASPPEDFVAAVGHHPVFRMDPVL